MVLNIRLLRKIRGLWQVFIRIGFISFILKQTANQLAENTLQFEWIVLIKLGWSACFLDQENVFVAYDLFWYPVEGRPEVRLAPDVLVALGRPKGHRGSYMQWLEERVAPQVVFEILSPGNRPAEMVRKFEFYQRYGVQEYYVYDPEKTGLRVSAAGRKIDRNTGGDNQRLGKSIVANSLNTLVPETLRL